jgi:hypothetical protein
MTTNGAPDAVLEATTVAQVMAALDAAGAHLPVEFPASPDLTALWSLPVEVHVGTGDVRYEVTSTAPWTFPPLPPATVVIRIVDPAAPAPATTAPS